MIYNSYYNVVSDEELQKLATKLFNRPDGDFSPEHLILQIIGMDPEGIGSEDLYYTERQEKYARKCYKELLEWMKRKAHHKVGLDYKKGR